MTITINKKRLSAGS